jgi:hypothetical protein
VNLAYRETLVHQDNKALEVHMECRELKVLQADLVILDRRVNRDPKEVTAFKDHQGLQGHQE